MSALWAELAAVLPVTNRPLIVGIDGGDGAGKTTLADAWAEQLRGDGRHVERASVDGFHFPRAHRHALGRRAEDVWLRHFDLHAVRQQLLDPWRAGPGASYRRAVHDVATDETLEDAPERVPAHAVLVVDGLYLQRAELGDAWDLMVFLDVTPEQRVARMARRDGLPDDPRDEAHQRYLQAFAHYVALYDPARWADVVIDGNADDWRLARCG